MTLWAHRVKISTHGLIIGHKQYLNIFDKIDFDLVWASNSRRTVNQLDIRLKQLITRIVTNSLFGLNLMNSNRYKF